MEEVDEYLIKYVGWINEGKTYTDVREDLQNKGVPEEEITYIIRMLDDYIIESDIGHHNASVRRHVQAVGWVMLTLGLGITAYTYFSSGTYYIFHYGIIGAGILTILTGKVHDFD